MRALGWPGGRRWRGSVRRARMGDRILLGLTRSIPVQNT
jgi:hypothetical protein